MCEPEPSPEPEPGSADDDQIICPACSALNSEGVDFCEKCGGPLTGFATLSPYESIHAQGWFFRRAVSGPVRPIVLIGLWLLFAPGAVCVLLFAWDALHDELAREEGVGLYAVFMLAVLVPALAVCMCAIWLLFPIARECLRARHASAAQHEPQETDG